MFRCRHCGNFDKSAKECCLYGVLDPNTEACRNYVPRSSLEKSAIGDFLSVQNTMDITEGKVYEYDPD